MKTAIVALSLTLYGLIPGTPTNSLKPTIVSVSQHPETHGGLTGGNRPQLSVDVATARLAGLCTQWWPTALRAGWREEDLAVLDMVMFRESRCHPFSHNAQDPFGGSFGLMQVNGGWRGWLREQGVIRRRSDLMIPSINLRASRLIWEYAKEKHNNGWNPWNL